MIIFGNHRKTEPQRAYLQLSLTWNTTLSFTTVQRTTSDNNKTMFFVLEKWEYSRMDLDMEVSFSRNEKLCLIKFNVKFSNVKWLNRPFSLSRNKNVAITNSDVKGLNMIFSQKYKLCLNKFICYFQIFNNIYLKQCNNLPINKVCFLLILNT